MLFFGINTTTFLHFPSRNSLYSNINDIVVPNANKVKHEAFGVWWTMQTDCDLLSFVFFILFDLVWVFFWGKRGFSQVLKIRMVIVWDKTGQDLIFRLKYHTNRCFQVINHSFIRSQNEFSVKSKYTRFSSTKFGINLKYLFFLGILNIEFRFGLVTIVIEISLKSKRLASS